MTTSESPCYGYGGVPVGTIHDQILFVSCVMDGIDGEREPRGHVLD